MNHLEASFTGKNSLWRYVVLIMVVFIASNAVGSLPFLIVHAMASAADPEAFSKISSDSGSLSLPGVDENLMFVLMMFPFIAGLAAFALLIKPFHLRTFISAVNGTGNIRWKRFFTGAFVWMVLMIIYLVIYQRFDPGNFTVNNKTASLIVLSLLSFLLIPFQAAFEEVIFRGYLMQGFAVLFRNRVFPLLATSVIFALMHSLNPEVKEFGFFTIMPQYLIFGLIFGLMTIMDDGIEAALGAHSANNIFLCIMVTHESSALKTPALYEQQIIYPWTEFVFTLLLGIVVVFVMKKIFRWGSFSAVFGKIRP